MTVLFIALMHTIPIFVATAAFRTMNALNIATCAMCIVAIATGAFSYVLFDFVAIGLAYYYASDWVQRNKRVTDKSQDYLP